VNDNWGVGVYERYEANTGFLEEQRYTLHRDLSSWVASLSGVIRNNGSVKEYGVILTFTLKALPKLAFDLNYDPGAPDDPAR
jgi:LPS-assembly protein